MKLTEVFNREKPSFSFEVFPPKTSDKYESVKTATEEIAKLNPSYMSVTYGAGGGTSEYTVSIAENLLQNFGVTPLAHLTCVSSTKQAVKNQLEVLKSSGIENILALRGDIPKEHSDPSTWSYHYASELIADIKSSGDFCIGAACYPEGHPESPNIKVDIENLKRKVDAGCDFLTTQMFFDNNIFYNFLYRIREAGIDVPVVAGIMPITSANYIKRTKELSGNFLPPKFVRIVDRYSENPAAMKQAGIAYATEQVIDLFANGIKAVHIYTMNKPDVAEKIQSNLSEII